MIKIRISPKVKTKIKDIFWDDAKKYKTSIVNILRKAENRNYLLDRHPKIYDRFYDLDGNLIEDELKKLLLADRDEMKEYIAEFGVYENKDCSKELLGKIFRYDTFSYRKSAITILKNIDVTVCPYCNRQYIFTLSSGNVRPQFDHYYPKSVYPYLALTLFNMIPSCSVCNMAKSSLDTLKCPILYPYDEEFGYDVKFTLKLNSDVNYVKMIQGISDEFTIQIDNKSNHSNDEIDNQISKLHLDELYNEHKMYVKDMMRSRYINTPERVNELYLKFRHIFGSKDDVYGLLYMSDLKKESWGKRPLSKLTHDISVKIKNKDYLF